MPPYRGTSLIGNSAPLRPYSRTKYRALWWPSGGWRFLMSEVPLYRSDEISFRPNMAQIPRHLSALRVLLLLPSSSLKGINYYLQLFKKVIKCSLRTVRPRQATVYKSSLLTNGPEKKIQTVLPSKTKVEIGTSQSKRGTSVDFSKSGCPGVAW